MKPCKPKLCKSSKCGKEFVPRVSMQTCCCITCAVNYTTERRAEKAKQEERKADKIKREELKSRRDWLNDAQVVFNKWIRLRDADEPCISCGRNHNGQWHAGHYRSVAAASQHRFSEFNVNKQCQPCNTHKSGNVVEYRINLIKKIGSEAVERLESTNETVKWTIEDAKRIKQEYAAKIKQHNRTGGIIS